jgi:integrase
VSTYRRGKIWWFRFKFQGLRIRETSNSPVRAVAQRLERERRRNLELAVGNLKKIGAPILFSTAAAQWLENQKPHWSAANYRIESYNVRHLLPHFDRHLLSDIDEDRVSRYRAKRMKEVVKHTGKCASPKTINNEIACLRAILIKHRLWANLKPDVKPLPTYSEIGRALSQDEVTSLLEACRRSRSRSLYPAVVIALSTGLRNAELRNLRWRNIDLLKGELTVGKSKTAGGEGRIVPLTKDALTTLQTWRSNFRDAQPDHYVFPSERYGLKGEAGHKSGMAVAYDIDPTQPIGPWKFSWDTARKDAKVQCRWHDLRHTFISRIAEGQASDATIMALSGHLSKKMTERYSHVRNEAKRAAIAALENMVGISEGAQKWAQ